MLRIFSFRAGGIALAAVALVAAAYFFMTGKTVDAPDRQVSPEVVATPVKPDASAESTSAPATGGGTSSETAASDAAEATSNQPVEAETQQPDEATRAAEAAAAKQAADAELAKQARAAEAAAAKQAADALLAEQARVAAEAEAAKQAAEQARLEIEKAAEAAQAEAEAAARKAQAAAEAAVADTAAALEKAATTENAQTATGQATGAADAQMQSAKNAPAAVVSEPAAEPAIAPDVAVSVPLPSAETAVPQAPAINAATPEAPEVATGGSQTGAGLDVASAPETDRTRATTSIEAPSFDLVRVAPDGGSVIAGRAAPNSTVDITADGQVIGTATANAKGEFVALLTAPASEKPLSLGLISRSDSGERAVSVANVLILSSPPGQPDAGGAASEAPILLRETADSIEIIQPAPLPVPDQIVIDSIGYDREGAVEISGRGRPTFQVRLYMNGRFVERADIGDDGLWSVRLSDVAEGLYTLRVDEVDDDGVVASRAETPFQRIFPDQLPDVDASGADRYTVQPGNNLWTIAKNRYGEGLDYWQIFRANQGLIRDPDLIYPGQVFALPDDSGNGN